MSYILDFVNNIRDTALSIGINDIIEILIMTYAFYKLFVWMRETRAWFVVKGLVTIGVLFIVAEILQLNTIIYIVKNSIIVILIAIVVVFQKELRAFIEKVGKKSFLRDFFSNRVLVDSDVFSNDAKEELVNAVVQLGKTKTGALIVIEREDPLSDFITTGIDLNADISSQLLVNIFEHNTPLHDGAVIVRGRKILSATSLLPLTKRTDIDKAFGTRHRAAIGLSEVTDSVTLVVSEETGKISVAMEGQFYANISEERLRAMLSGIVEEQQREDTKKSIFPWRKEARS